MAKHSCSTPAGGDSNARRNGLAATLPVIVAAVCDTATLPLLPTTGDPLPAMMAGAFRDSVILETTRASELRELKLTTYRTAPNGRGYGVTVNLSRSNGGATGHDHYITAVATLTDSDGQAWHTANREPFGLSCGCIVRLRGLIIGTGGRLPAALTVARAVAAIANGVTTGTVAPTHPVDRRYGSIYRPERHGVGLRPTDPLTAPRGERRVILTRTAGGLLTEDGELITAGIATA